MNYTREELHYLNAKHGYGWIRMPDKNDPKQKYVLYATGDATMNGRIYIALPDKPLSYEDKIKHNIM